MMKIELYPNFDEVFNDNKLRGIFYPLCSIVLDDENQTKLFFVSSNGIWTKEENTEDNSPFFTKFILENGKYTFKGSLEIYKGYQNAKEIFSILEKDFEQNGKSYLENKIQEDTYIKQRKKDLKIKFHTDFDIDYYLQTFYEFSINKLNFELNNQFGAYREIINGWRKNEEKSSIVYDCSESIKEIEINAEYLFPKSIQLSEYHTIGKTVGYEFFTDGNDCILLFNPNDQTILCVNSYS